MDGARRAVDGRHADADQSPPARAPTRPGPAGATSSCGLVHAGASTEGGPVEAAPGPGQHAWDRFMPWWHCAFAATVAVTAAFAAIEVQGGVRLAALMALYGGLVLLYVLTLARPSPSGTDARRVRPGFIYLALAFAIFAASCALFAGSALLLFILIPHCFMLLRLRPALVAVAGLVLVNGGAELGSIGISTATVASVAIGGVFTLLLAMFLGTFIDRIMDQSRQRAELIEELERTRGKLAELSREAGALAERERLAREIHDALAQAFTSVIMLVQGAQAALDRGDLTLVGRQLGLCEGAARDGLSEARALIGTLAPVALQGASLSGAIARVCEDVGARFGFVARFVVHGEPTPLSNNAEIVLLRAAQEALANVGRHACAANASVTLTFETKTTSLEVADDGTGFDVGQAAGFGLSQLRSRAGSWVARPRSVQSPVKGPGSSSAFRPAVSGLCLHWRLRRAPGRATARHHRRPRACPTAGQTWTRRQPLPSGGPSNPGAQLRDSDGPHRRRPPRRAGRLTGDVGRRTGHRSPGRGARWARGS